MLAKFAYHWFILWYNLPSIAGVYSIIRNGKGYVVITKSYGRSYVIVLLILSLNHLKYESKITELYPQEIIDTSIINLFAPCLHDIP